MTDTPHEGAPPIRVWFDESGHAGDDLINGDQPVRNDNPETRGAALMATKTKCPQDPNQLAALIVASVIVLGAICLSAAGMAEVPTSIATARDVHSSAFCGSEQRQPLPRMLPTDEFSRLCMEGQLKARARLNERVIDRELLRYCDQGIKASLRIWSSLETCVKDEEAARARLSAGSDRGWWWLCYNTMITSVTLIV